MLRTIAVAGTALVLAGTGGAASAAGGGTGIAHTLSSTAGSAGLGAANGLARHGGTVADTVGLDGPVVGPGDLGRGPVSQ